MNEIEEAVDALCVTMCCGKVMNEFKRSNKGELFILKYLLTKNAPVLPSELGEALNSTYSRISATLGVLEKKGQIHREINMNNRRNILVTLTDAWRERSLITTKQICDHLTKVVTEMGVGEVREYVRLSTKFFEIAERTMPDKSEYTTADLT